MIGMVDGEYDHVETYDEGPGSRKAGALPPGMAAVDAAIADCIEDTFAAGYTEDHLVQLLFQAPSYVPPGMNISAMGVNSNKTGLQGALKPFNCGHVFPISPGGPPPF
jgi:hypothetical protein